jgi:hypothetical protein
MNERPLHLTVKFFPSGIPLKSTSILAKAKTSFAGERIETQV